MRVIYLLLLTLFATVSQAFAQDSASVHPVNIGLVYPLGVFGMQSANQVDRVSFFVIAGKSKSVTATAVAGVSNIITELGTGVQVAGFSNHIGTTWHSTSVAGFMNLVKSHADGVMLAGFLNKSVSFRGVQFAGFTNLVKKEVYGTQLAGFYNHASMNTGIQLAGFANTTGKAGVQVAGFLNKATDVKLQVGGFVNIAKKVKGVQVAGFINIADSSDCPIGLINIVKGGERQIAVSIDETGTLIGAFKSGGRRLYGILGVGYNVKESRSYKGETDHLYALQGGIGANLLDVGVARLKLEVTNTTLTAFKGSFYNKSALSILPSVRFGNRFEIFGGPTFNAISTKHGLGNDLRKHYIWSDHYSHERFNAIYIGVTGGLAMTI